MNFAIKGKADLKSVVKDKKNMSIATAENIENAYDNPVAANVFFRRNPDINDDSKLMITHKSEIINSNKSITDVESKIDESIRPPTPQQMEQPPSSFIYSQVYPVNFENKLSYFLTSTFEI